MKIMLPNLKNEGFVPEVMSYGGDYCEDSKGSQVSDWQTGVYDKLMAVVRDTYPDVPNVYTLGNHDFEAINESQFQEIFGFTRTGAHYVADDYEIYHIGAQSNTAGQGKEEYYDSDIIDLDNYLASKIGSGKCIFIQTHWPLHRGDNFYWRTIKNASKVIDTLNKYAEQEDIVFLWGHNHYTDTNRHTIVAPGGTINYAEGASKTIEFTYANVGCMNDMYYLHTGGRNVDCGPGACLSVGLDDDKITFVYNKVDDTTTSSPKYSHNADLTLKNVYSPRDGIVVVDRIQHTEPGTPIYEDASGEYSFAERAADLVARMSVSQKGSQMISSPAPAISASDMGGGALNTTATKDLPSYYWWNEGLHGYNRIDNGASAKNNVGPANSVSYPQSLTVGSTWNPELYYQEALQVSDEIRERTDINTQTGNAKDLNFYSPTINLQRDPRWGRNEEAYSEDVYLTSVMGAQYVLGLEGKDQDGNLLDPDGYYKVHSTIKHYVANNSEKNRLNGGAVSDLNALRNYYVQPYRNIIKSTDVTSVMTAYSTFNGEPCSFSSYLMDTLLRQTFGLSGYITSDCDSVGTMTRHNYVNPHTGAPLSSV